MERAEADLGVPEQGDYFGAQIIAPPASCFFRGQEVLDFLRLNSVDWPVSAEMFLNLPHISLEFIGVRRRSASPGRQAPLNCLNQGPCLGTPLHPNACL